MYTPTISHCSAADWNKELQTAQLFVWSGSKLTVAIPAPQSNLLQIKQAPKLPTKQFNWSRSCQLNPQDLKAGKAWRLKRYHQTSSNRKPHQTGPKLLVQAISSCLIEVALLTSHIKEDYHITLSHKRDTDLIKWTSQGQHSGEKH